MKSSENTSDDPSQDVQSKRAELDTEFFVDSKKTVVTSSEAIPDKVGRFEVIRRLGVGGFGVVYLARDPQLDRFVALKVPKSDLFQNNAASINFVHEAQIAAKLKHDAIVAVYEVQIERGAPFIVQEFIDGENLAVWFEKNKPSVEKIANLVLEICNAMAYAHQQRLTHCDLKMANVLMDRQGSPHVSDFGLAIHDSTRVQHVGLRFGTPTTMAPEQARGDGHKLDGRTDIWAIGVMLYEMLVGQRPFASNQWDELLYEIENVEPRPPRQINSNIPRELERICLKCLAKRPEGRYLSIDDLSEDITGWLGQSNQVANKSTTASVNPSGMSTNGSTKRFLANLNLKFAGCGISVVVMASLALIASFPIVEFYHRIAYVASDDSSSSQPAPMTKALPDTSTLNDVIEIIFKYGQSQLIVRNNTASNTTDVIVSSTNDPPHDAKSSQLLVRIDGDRFYYLIAFSTTENLKNAITLYAPNPSTNSISVHPIAEAALKLSNEGQELIVLVSTAHEFPEIEKWANEQLTQLKSLAQIIPNSSWVYFNGIVKPFAANSEIADAKRVELIENTQILIDAVNAKNVSLNVICFPARQ